MSTTLDRLDLLRDNQAAFTGIDFIHVVDRCDQKTLEIFFQTALNQLTFPFQGATRLTADRIFIEPVHDPTLPTIPVVSIDEVGSQNQAQQDPDSSRWFIRIHVAEPGDFARYRIRIEDPRANPDPRLEPFSRIDPFFNDVEFSFKAACDDSQDCQPAPLECPPETRVDFPVDYLARDFVSFRNALLDFAGQRFPSWTLPNDADVGTMLMEVFAALGDEFSYIQDRYAREAFLETASQRRSLRKKARLLDFEMHDGQSASTFLALEIDPSQLTPDGNIPGVTPATKPFVQAGQSVWAASDNAAPVPFEIGRGIHDHPEGDPNPRHYQVRVDWNPTNLVPFTFDRSQACLPVGATEVFVEGVIEDADIIRDADPPHLMALRTGATGVAHAHLVRVVDIVPDFDPLQNLQITRIVWNDEDALPFQMDQADLSLSLNIVPATAGETLCTRFSVGPLAPGEVVDPTPCQDAVEIPPPVGEAMRRAVEREGPLSVLTGTRPTIVLFGLPETDVLGLGFLGDDLRTSIPEIRVEDADGVSWTFERTLIGIEPDDPAFTLEDGLWQAIRRFRNGNQDIIHQDYASGSGYTLRFGDGEFGLPAVEGDRFVVHYRTGPGTRANVAADTVNAPVVDGRTRELPLYVATITNPLPVTNGADPETLDEVRQLAPHAFRSRVFFAVRPEDFEVQVQTLPFVQRAHGSQRWTGSWSSIFVSADPFGASNLVPAQRDQLVALTDCVRQAGRDVVVRDPDTLSIDLEIVVCVETFAYAAHVVTQVQEVLFGPGTGTRVKGFFHPDNFTFGTPLRRSALEAAIQTVAGVRSVRQIRIRARGLARFRSFSELTFTVGIDQILRLDNDPVRPENGTLTLITEGGA